MPKNRKEKTENKIPENISREISLEDQIRNISEGLFYISETDAEVFPFVGEKAEDVTGEEILKQTKTQESANLEERDFEDFFERLTQFQNWFGEEDKGQAQKFGELKVCLEENLRDLKVFKVGTIEIDIYAVGLDKEGRLTGIKTKAVET